MAVGTAGDRAESTYFARAIVDSRATLHLSYRLAVRFVQWDGGLRRGVARNRPVAGGAARVRRPRSRHLAPLPRNQRFGLGWRPPRGVLSPSPLPPSQYYDNAWC